MRLKLLAAVILAWVVAPAAAQDAQFVSETFSTDLPLAEVKEGVHRIILECRLGHGGRGTLTLDPNVPRLDAFGELVAGGNQAPLVRLEFLLKLVKEEKGRRLYEIRGPKITSRLFLAVFPNDSPWVDGRLVVQNKDGEIRYAINLTERSRRLEPCHPGCFPAGTPVQTPAGALPIERVKVGQMVTTVGPDGQAARGVVKEIFTTKNRLVEVRTDHGAAVTTDAQPFCLVDGGFQRAGELKPGNRIWQWRDGRRQEAVVREVVATGRTEPVFNLILGDSAVFVAGGFLVRGKPPAGAFAAEGDGPVRP
jgi:hypothetical protein